MARSLSAEETHAEYLSILGPELGALYYALYNELAWLHIKWRQYRELYGMKPERLELLNEAAPLFFRLLQDSLWEDTLLHISRLTDSPESMGKPNLTIRRLPSLIASNELRVEVAVLVETAVRQSDFARDWRNRHIAHRDLALAKREPTEPLAPASRQMVTDALRALADVLNQVSVAYLSSTIVFDMGADPGDAVAMLWVLREGLTAERARRQRVVERRFTPEDLVHPPAV